MRNITIPLTEDDIEAFKDIVYGNDMSLIWVFPFDNSKEDVQITFIQEGDGDND